MLVYAAYQKRVLLCSRAVRPDHAPNGVDGPDRDPPACKNSFRKRAPGIGPIVKELRTTSLARSNREVRRMFEPFALLRLKFTLISQCRKEVRQVYHGPVSRLRKKFLRTRAKQRTQESQENGV